MKYIINAVAISALSLGTAFASDDSSEEQVDYAALLNNFITAVMPLCDTDAEWEQGLRGVNKLRTQYQAPMIKKEGQDAPELLIPLSTLATYAGSEEPTFSIEVGERTYTFSSDKETLSDALPSKLRVGTVNIGNAYFDAEQSEDLRVDRNSFDSVFTYQMLGGWSGWHGGKNFPVHLTVYFNEQDIQELVDTFKAQLCTKVETICDKATDLLMEFLINGETPPEIFPRTQATIHERRTKFLEAIEKGTTKEELDQVNAAIIEVALSIRDNYFHRKKMSPFLENASEENGGLSESASVQAKELNREKAEQPVDVPAAPVAPQISMKIEAKAKEEEQPNRGGLLAQINAGDFQLKKTEKDETKKKEAPVTSVAGMLEKAFAGKFKNTNPQSDDENNDEWDE